MSDKDDKGNKCPRCRKSRHLPVPGGCQGG